jgi:hypothetical protein
VHHSSLKELASAWFHLGDARDELRRAIRRLNQADPLGHLPKVENAIKEIEKLIEILR